jgi:hypothetical protein
VGKSVLALIIVAPSLRGACGRKRACGHIIAAAAHSHGYLCHRAVTTPRIAPHAIRICCAWTTAHGPALSRNHKQAAASAPPLMRLEKIMCVALVISYHHHVEQWTFQRILVQFGEK